MSFLHVKVTSVKKKTEICFRKKVEDFSSCLSRRGKNSFDKIKASPSHGLQGLFNIFSVES